MINPDMRAVNIPNRAYGSMLPLWQMVDTLLGGTQSMRDAGESYLPREAAESIIGYQSRINKTFLFNGFKHTVDILVGKPFAEDVHLIKELDAEGMSWLQDMDREGNDITACARQIMEIGLEKGLVHVLCDYPTTPVGAGGAPITIAVKEQQNIRPYINIVDPVRVIGWQYAMEQGVPVLSEVRIREQVTVQKPGFQEAVVNRVRVFDRLVVEQTPIVSYRLFEERLDPSNMSSKNWFVVESGFVTTAKIPLVTIYFGKRTGFMMAEPPLRDLAYMNIEHWQSSSDQRHVLHIARVPIWFLSGYEPTIDDDGNAKEKIQLGPDRLVRVSAPDAKLTIVEHTGKAIESGRLDIQDIEARMAIAGAELLASKSSAKATATEEAHDNDAEDSNLSSMVKREEDGLTTIINFMYEWEGKPAPSPGKLVTINTDFGLTPQDAADLQVLYQSRMAGLMSQPTYLKELQRRGVLAPSVDLAVELTAAKADGPVVVPKAEASTGEMTTKGGPGA